MAEFTIAAPGGLPPGGLPPQVHLICCHGECNLVREPSNATSGLTLNLGAVRPMMSLSNHQRRSHRGDGTAFLAYLRSCGNPDIASILHTYTSRAPQQTIPICDRCDNWRASRRACDCTPQGTAAGTGQAHAPADTDTTSGSSLTNTVGLQDCDPARPPPLLTA